MEMYVTICIVSLFVSALTLFSGFGLGTLLMPAFSLFFPIEVAIGATAVVHLINNVVKACLVGRLADPATTVKFAIPAAAAAATGAYLLSKLGSFEPLAAYTLFGKYYRVGAIKLVVGSLLVIFAMTEVLPKFQKLSVPAKFIPLGGLISGFFGGLSGVQGALRAMFLIRANLSKEQFVGTTVLSAVIVDVSRLAVYGATIFSSHFVSLKQEGVAGLVAAGTVAAAIGSVVGSRLLKKVTLKTLQFIVSALLFVVGVGLAVGFL